MGAKVRSCAAVALVLLAVGCGAPGRQERLDGPGPDRADRSEPAWGQFRGPRASGRSTGAALPTSWDGETGTNVIWSTEIPGLAHSSPIVAGDRIYLTTAINTRGDSDFKPGLYGSGDAAGDRVPHQFAILAVDPQDGRIAWTTVVHEGIPQDKRHVKATYANASPATDGRMVVAMFGSEGLFAVDAASGALRWSLSLGRLDTGAYDAPSYEWGSASSPVIHRGVVFQQCDHQGDSFLLAVDLQSGRELWRVDRDEPPTWSTPTIWSHAADELLVTNGGRWIQGYDPESGRERFRLGGSSKIPTPTPVFDPESGLLVVASGRRPEKPIFVIRPGARGDLTLPEGSTSSTHIAWSVQGRGPYMPTPILLDGRLYSLNNNGVFDAYDLSTGDELYRERIQHVGSGFSASPVTDGHHLFLSGEDGDTFVVRPGDRYQQVDVGRIPDLVMATPALAHGRLYIRSQTRLWSIGRTSD